MLLDFTRLFGKTKKSNKLAKERLKLVLVHDRSNVSPHFLEMLKSDIVKVINNYMDVDEDALDIQLTRVQGEQGEGLVPALIANIPIRNVKKSGR